MAELRENVEGGGCDCSLGQRETTRHAASQPLLLFEHSQTNRVGRDAETGNELAPAAQVVGLEQLSSVRGQRVQAALNADLNPWRLSD